MHRLLDPKYCSVLFLYFFRRNFVLLLYCLLYFAFAALCAKSIAPNKITCHTNHFCTISHFALAGIPPFCCQPCATPLRPPFLAVARNDGDALFLQLSLPTLTLVKDVRLARVRDEIAGFRLDFRLQFRLDFFGLVGLRGGVAVGVRVRGVQWLGGGGERVAGLWEEVAV